MNNVKDLLLEQLKDILSAEMQLVEALPKTAKACATAELRKGIESHLAETKDQVKRLEQIGKKLGRDLSGTTCPAMKGLIKEAGEIMGHDEAGPLRDAMIVSIAQKIEHYEIAAYGNARTIAAFLELQDVYSLLSESLEEEKSANDALTDVTEEFILPECEEVDDAAAQVHPSRSLR